MKISLYLLDKIVDFKLPNEISGSFSFDVNEDEESKLINVEARDNQWVLYHTSDVDVVLNNTLVGSLVLNPNQFYTLRRNKQNFLIYVSDMKLPNLFPYNYGDTMQLVIGRGNSVSIRYDIPYIGDASVSIRKQNNRLLLERLDTSPVYINKNAVKEKAQFINNGDEVEIYGLRILFLNGLFFINNIMNQLFIDVALAQVNKHTFPVPEAPLQQELKEIDLYSKENYFSKSPRLKRVIETKTIKLSAPPKEGESQEIPIILVIGPMLTMGVMAGTMLLNTIMRIQSGETTMASSWPQILTSGAMLISMLVWPLVTQAYNRHMKKKKKQEIIVKYNQYLDEKREELRKEVKLQKDILFENLITVENCLDILKTKNLHFWDKRIDQSDFLVTRLGMGSALLDVKVEYPEEGFTIEESELRKKADEMVEEFKYIENVPVGYSFYENRITAIMGNQDKVTYFMHNILLQLITFYSYEDLKIVLFTNENRKKNWEYLKYLNHTFDNAREFRFFSSTQESMKNVSEYLNMELNNRLMQTEGSNTPIFKPHYFVIVDDYDRVKRQDFIKRLAELDVNVGFSLIILEDRLSKLPSKCNNFITLGSKNSGILKNSYENQEQIIFNDQINYQVNMLQIAKILSNIPIEFENGLAHLPDAITFLEMEKVGKVEQLNILNRWNINDATTSLKAEVGVDEQGDLMYLDLHEKYHGPHGLIAGMTGSGKSEFIITYILSMAINYSPDDIAFILIDYKGGGLAFAFENQSAGMILPHLAGTITNLDKAEMDRTLVSIDSEIKRRQRVFNEARDALGESTIDIYKYQKFYKEGKLQEPIPHLFIICDEFAELKSQQPEFMDNLISVARIGRSLGVHLILATQKPSGVVNDQIWSNTKFRVCLKVQDESDSKEMLKRGDAAYLKQAGRFYLQVGYDEYFALGQSGWCGAKYYPSDKIVKQVDKSVNFIDDCGFYIKSIQAANSIRIEAKGEQLAATMHSIIQVAERVQKKARRLWLENIPAIITETFLASKYQIQVEPYYVEAILGEYDAPEKQEQGIVKYNFIEDGNTIIYGTDGGERENLLDVLIYSSTKQHSVNEIQYYIIDYGSESLRKYMSLPHVGGIVFASEEEKYNNLLKMIREELQTRKKLFVNYGGEYVQYNKNHEEKMPLKVIIINNYDSFYESNQSAYEELPDLVRDSERYGIIFIFTANAINSISSKIAQNFPNIYAFRLKDASDYTIALGSRTRMTPRDIEGRGLLKNDGVHEFQTASIVEDKNTLNEFIAAFVQEQKQVNQKNAQRIPTLPDIVRYEDVVDEIRNLQNVPVGISKGSLEIVTLDLFSNIGNIITSNKIVNTENLVKSLLSILVKIDNNYIIIIDALQRLKLDSTQYPNYYTSQFEEVLEQLDQSLIKQIEAKSTVTGVIVIYGLNKFVSKIKETNKLTTFMKHLKEYEKMALIIVDDAPKIKPYAFEAWFTTLFNTRDGIWVGRGVSEQNVLRLSNITKEMSKDYKNDMGYMVNEGLGTLCKWIDFVSKDGGDESNEK